MNKAIKTTEGIIPFIQRNADGHPACRLDLIPNVDKFMELMEKATEGMFDKGKFYWFRGKKYMIQQPMESHNID